MAIYHFDVSIVQRSKGQSSVAKAAYNSRSKLTDERTDTVYNYTRKKDLVFSEILLPTNAPDWVANRQNLWSQAELSENRRNSQPAKQIIAALPQELNDIQNQELVRSFVLEELVKLGMAADVNLHQSHEDSSNPHVHILLTARGFENGEFAKKKNRDWFNREHLKVLRERWAYHVNKSLAAYGHDARVDHRSLKDQGIDRIPQVHLGPAASAMAKRGVSTDKLEQFNAIAATNAKLSKLASQKQKLAEEEKAEREELQQLERNLNLVDFAIAEGYVKNVKKSTRSSIHLEHPHGDRIVVKPDPIEFDTYFSTQDNSDCGTIVDFIQRRQNLGLAQIRQLLRRLSKEKTPSRKRLRVILPDHLKQRVNKQLQMKKESEKLLSQRQWVNSLTLLESHSYLEGDLGLSAATFKGDRFADRVLLDQSNNVVFPYSNDSGSVSGYELRNRELKGFRQGGVKSLWRSNQKDSDRKLVIVKSPIDALSHYQLKQDKHIRYIATGGTFSALQKQMLKAEIDKMIANSNEIIIATDNDDAGEKLAREIKQLVRFPYGKREKPLAKDWNDDLLAQRKNQTRETNRRNRENKTKDPEL